MMTKVEGVGLTVGSDNMGLSSKQMKEVERIKKDPFVELQKGLSDKEILAQARFIENGDGMDIYDSEEDYRACMKNALE